MARKVEINDPAQLERYLEGRERGEREGAHRARTQFRAGHARPRSRAPEPEPAEAQPEAEPATRTRTSQRGATLSQATAGASSLAPSSGGVWAVLVIAALLTVGAVLTNHFSFGFFLAVLILIFVGALVPIIGILIGGTALLYVVLTHGTEIIPKILGLYSQGISGGSSSSATATSGGTA